MQWDLLCVCVCEKRERGCVCERQSVCEVWSSTSLYNSSLQFPQPQKGVIFLSTKWDNPCRNEDQCLVPSQHKEKKFITVLKLKFSQYHSKIWCTGQWHLDSFQPVGRYIFRDGFVEVSESIRNFLASGNRPHTVCWEQQQRGSRNNRDAPSLME